MSRERCVKCPLIDSGSLRNAIDLLDWLLDKPGERFFKTIRSITLKALSRAPGLRTPTCSEGGESSG